MLGEEVGIWNTATSSELAGMKVQLMLVAPLLPDSVDADLGRRLDHRAEVLLTDWSEDLLAEGATSPSSWPPGR